jgi:hypothetical protein
VDLAGGQQLGQFALALDAALAHQLKDAGTTLLEGGDGGLGHGAVVSTRLVGSLYALKAHEYAQGLQIFNQYQAFVTDLCARPW